MTVAHVAPGGATIRYVDDLILPPEGWIRLPLIDIHPSLGVDEVCDGPMVTVTDAAVVRTWTVSPAPVPQEVSARQARLALLGAGLLDRVEIAVLSADKSIQIDWEYAIEVRRASLLVVNIGEALGLTSDEIDRLFRSAAKL